MIEGTIEGAPLELFDAATCLLTLHFLDAAERERSVRQVHARLRPGAPFVAAHGCLPRDRSKRALWLDRYAAYAAASGVNPEEAANARAAVDANVNMLAPEQDEAICGTRAFLTCSRSTPP